MVKSYPHADFHGHVLECSERIPGFFVLALSLWSFHTFCVLLEVIVVVKHDWVVEYEEVDDLSYIRIDLES